MYALYFLLPENSRSLWNVTRKYEEPSVPNIYCLVFYFGQSSFIEKYQRVFSVIYSLFHLDIYSAIYLHKKTDVCSLLFSLLPENSRSAT